MLYVTNNSHRYNFPTGVGITKKSLESVQYLTINKCTEIIITPILTEIIYVITLRFILKPSNLQF